MSHAIEFGCADEAVNSGDRSYARVACLAAGTTRRYHEIERVLLGAAGEQGGLDVAQAQAEAEIPAHRAAEDDSREAVAVIRRL